MKKITVWALALCMALQLAGCGPAQQAAGSEAAPTALPTLKPACDHLWSKATYWKPRICLRCGETQGKPVPAFFEEQAIPVEDAPADHLRTGRLYNVNDRSEYQLRDFPVAITEYRVEPGEDGYNTVTLGCTISAAMWESADGVSLKGVSFSSGFFDYYTGKRLPLPKASGDEEVSYEYTLEMDDAVWELSYSKTNRWEPGEWSELPDGSRQKEVCCVQTFVFHLPKEYDGLVYASISSEGAWKEGEEPPPGSSYCLDEGKELLDAEGTRFFRLKNAVEPGMGFVL